MKTKWAKWERKQESEYTVSYTMRNGAKGTGQALYCFRTSPSSEAFDLHLPEMRILERQARTAGYVVQDLS